MSEFRVFLDACVLMPINLCDFVLRLAETEIFQPQWTAEVLGEVERNLVAKIGITQERAASRVRAMESAFPDAMVHGYQDLTNSMTCDPKDRHVLAGAVRGGADALVTANLKDFPPSSTEQYELQVIHPDTFLLDQIDLYSREVLQVLHETVERRNRPPATVTDLLLALRGPVPQFAQFASGAVGDPSGLGESAIMYRSDDEPGAQEAAQFYPNGIDDLTNAKTVAWRWYTSAAGAGRKTDFRRLSANVKDFSPKSDISEMLSGYGLAGGIEFAIDDPDKVAYMKFVPSNDRLIRAMNSGSHDDMLALTLARLDPGAEWRVFSIGNRYSTPREIFL